ncbi:MAG: type III pantothenate kinase [Saccharofermentanales bacterium]|jgi:type III pantothenate kinase|nr:type III pantothenate kinase [Clostridiaceae bacterium]
MLLVCAIENSDINLGVFDRDQLLFSSWLSASRSRSADEYAILMDNVFRMNRQNPAAITGAVLASVVRPLNDVFCQAIRQIAAVQPLMVGPGVKTGLNIKTDIPSQVGADIVANAVGAAALEKGALVVLDFGIATTLTGINDAGELCGVLIAPGLETSLEALSAQAAELPFVALDQPGALFGKNTVESMTSGFIYGFAAMVDGLLDRIAGFWNTETLTIIATGRLAPKVIPYCIGGRAIRHEPHLPLYGLKLIHQLNNRRRI